MTVQQTFRSRPAGLRRPHESDKYNDMLAEILYDLQNIITQTNANEASIEALSNLLFNEFMNARNAAQDRVEDIRNQHKLAGILGENVYNFINMRGFRGPMYYLTFSGLPVARRARVEPIYGQAMLPANILVNRFYDLNPEDDEPVLPSELDITVTGEEEAGYLEIDEGTPSYAFNGQNRQYWIRKVSYPLEHDVDNVGVQVDVTLPDTFADRGNMLTVHPYPLGQLEIEEIKYSIDTSDPSIDLPGFEVVRGAGFERWVFSEITATKLRFKFRQRNFTEENGKKVFRIGAQEIGMQLVEWDQTAGETQPTNNNGFVIVVEAPDGYYFNDLKRLYSEPAYATVLSETGIRYRIYTDPNLSNEVWSSYDDDRLEDTNVPIGTDRVNKIYILVTLQFLTGQSVSPLLNNLLVGYDLTT